MRSAKLIFRNVTRDMVAFSNISQGKYNLSLKIFVVEIKWSYSRFLIWSL